MHTSAQPIIECVPNFSEGRDSSIIKAICSSIKKIPYVQLLHVDIGYDANRTVITFAGNPEAVIEAAFQAIKTASELIDMTKQKGAHPRFGATDVCPLIPVANISMEEVILFSKRLARRVGEELKIPVYLYENSASSEERKDLAHLRKGGYEAIKDRIENEAWKPDFGIQKFNSKSGNIAIGARNFLIAFNVNLKSNDLKLAQKIAAEVRTRRYDNLNYQTNNRCAALKAIAWEMPAYNCVQVSTNIIDYHKTGLHDAYKAIKSVAEHFGARVDGSELIGLVPLKAILDAGRNFATEANIETHSEIELIQLAENKLGLSRIKQFIPRERIVEYLINTQ